MYYNTSCIIYNRNATLLLQCTDKLISCETRELPTDIRISTCDTPGRIIGGASHRPPAHHCPSQNSIYKIAPPHPHRRNNKNKFTFYRYLAPAKITDLQ